jgi:hypothetical protein
MRAIAAVPVLSVCVLGASGIAQTGRPDFSGRWRLVEPATAAVAQDRLAVNAPDELLIAQTPVAITIEHPSTGPPNSRGLRITTARGSMWRLEGPTHLVIEFSEERTGERPKIATREYMKIAPQ